MTTLQQYLLVNTLASLYGEGTYNCANYDNAGACTTTGTTSGGGALAGTGMDVFLIGSIVLAVLVAGILLLVKRMRRQTGAAK